MYSHREASSCEPHVRFCKASIIGVKVGHQRECSGCARCPVRQAEVSCCPPHALCYAEAVALPPFPASELASWLCAAVRCRALCSLLLCFRVWSCASPSLEQGCKLHWYEDKLSVLVSGGCTAALLQVGLFVRSCSLICSLTIWLYSQNWPCLSVPIIFVLLSRCWPLCPMLRWLLSEALLV